MDSSESSVFSHKQINLTARRWILIFSIFVNNFYLALLIFYADKITQNGLEYVMEKHWFTSWTQEQQDMARVTGIIPGISLFLNLKLFFLLESLNCFANNRFKCTCRLWAHHDAWHSLWSSVSFHDVRFDGHLHTVSGSPCLNRSFLLSRLLTLGGLYHRSISHLRTRSTSPQETEEKYGLTQCRSASG